MLQRSYLGIKHLLSPCPVQVTWSERVAEQLKAKKGDALKAVESTAEAMLALLAETVLTPQQPVRRRKLEHLITELVHQRDVTRRLLACENVDANSFEWLSQMRFQYDRSASHPLRQLSVKMADASFFYGYAG